MDENEFENSGINIKDAKVLPCRYQSVQFEKSTEINVMCNPYIFGKLKPLQTFPMPWTMFHLSQSWG